MGLWSSLANMVQQRNLWKGRADSAWGASRVWNSGASWEANYNSEVALYNNEVAAYNAGIPPAGTVTIAGAVISTTFGPNTETVMMRCTADRSGNWFVAYWGHANGSDASNHADCNLYANGVLQGGRSTNWPVTISERVVAAFAGPFFLSAGQLAEARLIKTGPASLTVDVQAMSMVFVPTQANPH
jgi:hypothetical protein